MSVSVEVIEGHKKRKRPMHSHRSFSKNHSIIVAVHLASNHADEQSVAVSSDQAPLRHTQAIPLVLLPSGPDTVQEAWSRRTRSSTPLTTNRFTDENPRPDINPAIADCGLQGTATSPSSTTNLLTNQMEERVGFEPTVPAKAHSLSRRALSTTQTSLRNKRLSRSLATKLSKELLE